MCTFSAIGNTYSLSSLALLYLLYLLYLLSLFSLSSFYLLFPLYLSLSRFLLLSTLNNPHLFTHNVLGLVIWVYVFITAWKLYRVSLFLSCVLMVKANLSCQYRDKASFILLPHMMRHLVFVFFYIFVFIVLFCDWLHDLLTTPVFPFILGTITLSSSLPSALLSLSLSPCY